MIEKEAKAKEDLMRLKIKFDDKNSSLTTIYWRSIFITFMLF